MQAGVEPAGHIGRETNACQIPKKVYNVLMEFPINIFSGGFVHEKAQNEDAHHSYRVRNDYDSRSGALCAFVDQFQFTSPEQDQ
jgi:hypothetical protein